MSSLNRAHLIDYINLVAESGEAEEKKQVLKICKQFSDNDWLARVRNTEPFSKHPRDDRRHRYSNFITYIRDLLAHPCHRRKTVSYKLKIQMERMLYFHFRKNLEEVVLRIITMVPTISQWMPVGLAVAELWDPMVYGGDGKPEYGQDAHWQALVDWVDRVDGTTSAGMVFDFTTKGIMNAAVEGELWRLIDPQGKAPGVIGWWPAKAVTFIDNHDTGSTQQIWPFPSDKVMQGYVYILTHPGNPCIFYDHFFEWGFKEQITALVAVRQRNGITATSSLNIMLHDADAYVAEIDGKVLMKIGSRYDVSSLIPAGFQLAAHGNDYAVWEKIATAIAGDADA